MDSTRCEKIIKLSSNWLLSIRGLTSAVRLKWVETLPILFSDYLTKERILLFALRKETHPDDTDKEVVNSSIALLNLVSDELKEINDLQLYRKVKGKVDSLKQSYDVDDKTITSILNRYKEVLKKESERIPIQVPSTVWLLVIDHVLRWVILWYYQPDFEPIFWFVNVLFLPAAIIVMAWLRSRGINRFNRKLIESYNLPNVYFKPRRTTSQITLIVFLALIGVAASFAISVDYEQQLFLILGIIVGYVSYYSIYLKHFSSRRLQEKDLIDQLDNNREYTSDLSADENDEAIIDLNTRVRSIKGRLEAYVLESALFGALAFSGFLQIMAEELVSFQALEDFAKHSFDLFGGIIYWNTAQIQEGIIKLTSKSDLFALVSVETLICSIFFLAVIASRLRVGDVVDRVTRHLDLARAFNVKEENLAHHDTLNEDNKRKLSFYTQEIQENLTISEKGIMEMAPTTAYMRFFRNAGIVTFLIILISSALFISSFLSLMFAVAGLSSVVYFNRTEIGNILRRILVSIRWIFIRRGNIFLAAALIFMVGGFLLRTVAKWSQTDLFILIGFFFLGLYFFIWIVLIPHYDEKFVASQDIEKAPWWDTVRLIWGLSVFLSIQGLSFRIMDLPGGSAFLGIGIICLSIMLIFVGSRMASPRWAGMIFGFGLTILTFAIMFKSLRLPGSAQLAVISLPLVAASNFFINVKNTKPKRSGWIRGIGVTLIAMGIIFKMNHWIAASAWMYTGILALVILAVDSIFNPVQQRSLHKMLATNAIILIGIGVSVVGARGLFGESAYDNYTIDNKVIERINMLIVETSDLRGGMIDLGKTPEELKSGMELRLAEAEWYRNYSQNLGFTDDRRTVTQEFYDIGYHIWQNYDDEAALEWGYKFVHEANLMGEKIDFNADFYMNIFHHSGEGNPRMLITLEPLFLERLGRDSEARLAKEKLLERIAKGTFYQEQLQEDVEEFFN